MKWLLKNNEKIRCDEAIHNVVWTVFESGHTFPPPVRVISRNLKNFLDRSLAARKWHRLGCTLSPQLNISSWANSSFPFSNNLYTRTGRMGYFRQHLVIASNSFPSKLAAVSIAWLSWSCFSLRNCFSNPPMRWANAIAGFVHPRWQNSSKTRLTLQISGKQDTKGIATLQLECSTDCRISVPMVFSSWRCSSLVFYDLHRECQTSTILRGIFAIKREREKCWKMMEKWTKIDQASVVMCLLRTCHKSNSLITLPLAVGSFHNLMATSKILEQKLSRLDSFQSSLGFASAFKSSEYWPTIRPGSLSGDSMVAISFKHWSKNSGTSNSMDGSLKTSVVELVRISKGMDKTFFMKCFGLSRAAACSSEKQLGRRNLQRAIIHKPSRKPPRFHRERFMIKCTAPIRLVLFAHSSRPGEFRPFSSPLTLLGSPVMGCEALVLFWFHGMLQLRKPKEHKIFRIYSFNSRPRIKLHLDVCNAGPLRHL